MDILQGLQSILGQSMGGQANMGARSSSPMSGAQGDGGLGALGSLLNPEVLGGIAGALFSGKSGGAGMGAAAGGGQADMLGGLLSSFFGGGGGGGADLSSALGGLLGGGQAAPRAGQAPQQRAPSDPAGRAARFIRALVYAAKADGHIDDQEQAAINDQMSKLNVGPEGQALVKQAMSEPLDPNQIARGVQDSQEAVQLYVMSRALTNADHFMEKSYLDSLATALKIPAEVRTAVESKFGG